jgi:hypothetical protein
MRFIYCLLIFFLCINPILINAQSIDGSRLIELSKVAIEKSPVLKRNAYTVKNAEAELQIQRSIFDYNLNSNLSYQQNQ